MADKRFNLTFDVNANIDPIKAAANGLQQAFGKLKLSDSLQSSLDKTFSKLNNEIQNFESLASKGFTNLGDVSKAEKSFIKITDLLEQLKNQSKSITGLEPEKFLPKESIERVNSLRKSWGDLKKIADKGIENNTKIKAQNSEIKKAEQAVQNLTSQYNKLNSENKSLSSSKGINTKQINEYKTQIEEARKAQEQLLASGEKKSGAEYQDLEQQVKSANAAIAQLEKTNRSYDTTIQKNKATMNGLKTEISSTNTSVTDMKNELTKLQDEAKNPEGLAQLRQQLAALKNINIDEIPTDLEEIKQVIDNLNSEELKKITQRLKEIDTSAEGVAPAVDKCGDAFDAMKNSAQGLDQTAREVENLHNQILQFFSIGNAVQLFKRAVKSAFDTVKELDATMTETAVVTDFTVSDMWEQLPTYAAEANKLGAAINDLYGSTTLYYQQGLQTEAAMALGIETTKMARIANIEAADATNLMTAALRGFNMELNETSAQKVNDIYSELAAITAADTQEIGVAMSKTASIASSANMELETTAALLSQIIETTREAPETAGTAMKTIIARFSEVKELVNQGQLTGEDIEGEIIDVNKIQGALRSVGISMNEFFAGTEGLDDVLLKLASKWDTLDFTTQRYIATTAAGSRQQSRFIAMMSDYSRTQELVSAAYNSTGASQEQFEKTLDSLDAKLTKLKNAWDQFAMGLANNEFIKGAVDVLTFLLNTLNSIIDTVSGGNGVIKSLVSLGIAFSVFKGIKSLLSGSKFGGSIISNLFGGKGKAEAEAGQIGRQAGNSFITNFKKQIQNVRDNGLVKGLFSKDMAIELKKGADFSQVYSGLDDAQKIALQKNQQFKDSYLSSIQSINSQFSNSQLLNIQMEYDTNGIDAANAKVQELGGNIQITEEMVDTASQTMGTDFGAVANAAGAAGAAIMGMASALEANGASEELVGVIKAIGTALIALPAIFQLVSAAAKVFSIDVSASIMNIPIIGWIAAIISALIALAGILSSVIETDAEKMKRLSEETNRAKEAAEAASNAYSELKDSLSGIDEANKTLDNLVYGTQAWTEALLKVNEQVLDLITLYPQLMQYVTQGEYGQLEIRAEGIEELLGQQLEGVQNAQQGQLIATAKETQFTAQAEKNNILTDIKLGNIGVTETVNNGLETVTTTKYLEDEDIFNQISSFVKDNPLEMVNIANEEYSDAIYQAADAVGLSVYDFAELAKSIQSFDKTLGITETQVQSSIANTIRSDLSEASKESKYVNQVVSGLSKGYSGNIEQDVTDEKNTLTGKDSETNISSLAKELQEEGYNITSTDKNLETYQQVYAALSGRTLSDVKEADYSEDDLATMIAEIQQGNEYAANTEEIIAKIDRLAVINKTAADKAAAILSNDFSSLTKEQISELGKLKTGDNLKQQLIDWGILSANATEEELSAFLNKLGVDSFDALLKQTQDTASGTTEQFNNLVSDNFRGDNAEIASKLIEGATFGEAKSITDALNNAEAKGGDAAFDSLSSIITQLNNADIDEEEYRALLESLSSYDFSDPDQIEAFLDKVKEIAPNLPTSELDKWEKSLTESYNAVKTFSLDNLRNELKNTLDLIDDIKDRDSAKFNDEEYQQLISAGADKNDFIWNGQDWVYIGGTMEELASTLEANTSAVLENTIALLKNQIESGSQFNKGYQILKQSGSYSDTELELFRTGGFTNANDIASMYKSMGIDSIMDAKTGNYLNIAELLKLDGGDDRLVELYQAQANDATNLISNKEKLKDTEGIINTAGKSADEIRLQSGNTDLDNQTAASISQAEDAGLNTNELIAYRDGLIDITEKSEEVKTLSEAMATEIARDNMMMNEAISELSDNWNTWSVALKNGNKDAPEYATALTSIRSNMKKMLGITGNLSEEFLTNETNMKLMAKAAKGDAEAISQLRKEAAKDIAINIEDDDLKEKVSSLIDSIDLEDITLGATLDSTDFGASLKDMLESAGLTVDEISNILESLGFEPEVTYKEVPVDQVTTNTQTGESTYTDPITGKVYKTKMKAEFNAAGESVIKFPVINGSATTYKGPPSSTVSPSHKSSGGGGGGGGSKEDTKTWKNPYDKFYNTTEKINELLRQRNKLESEFDRLASRNATTAAQLNKNLRAQLKNLQDQVKSQNVLISGKRKQLQNAANATMSVEEGKTISFQKAFEKAGGSGSISKYGIYNETTGQIEINWEALEALQKKDAEQGEAVEAYISYLETISGELEEAQDSLTEIEDNIIALVDAQLDARVELLTTLKDAIVEQYQREIDKLSELNDTINDSNSNILNGIQESIDLSRQIRDNTKTEEDIAEKEARLAFLRRDTSGANDLEIKQLEKELEDARESYSDTLIDQEIDRLSKQNDEAAEARQKQIDLMQKQLDYWQSSDYFNSIIEAMDETEALELWKEIQDFNDKTEAEKISLMREWNALWNKGNAGNAELAAADSMYKGDKYTLTDSKGNKYSNMTYNSSNDTWSNGKVTISGSDISGADIVNNTITTKKDLSSKPTPTTPTPTPTPAETYPYGKASETSGNIKQGAKGNAVKAIQYALNKLGYGNSGTSSVDGIFGSNTAKAVRAFQKAMGIKQDGIVGKNTREKFKAKKYLTGGLADYTGLAWLDGSKSKPELVLNAKDTENFIVLKDVLSDILKGSSSQTKNSGDNYYDFHITVEEIANDYDVEKMIQKVKEEINNDARYRNVNAINLLR
jgi:TP901 family phage tail tape measure protein